MRIAVATLDGHEVDLHFGQAAAFTVFLVDERSIEQEKTILVEKYCSSDPDHTFHQQRFQAIAEALGDCRVVVSVRIGDLPRQALESAGLTHIAAAGPIEPALRSAYQLLTA